MTAWRCFQSPFWSARATHLNVTRLRFPMDFSDEDRDVDIESDDEVDSTGKNSGQQFQTQAEKRAHHNALERKRRDHIKDSFTGLRDSIPSLQGEKVASRAQILKRAADYIQYMRKKNCTHQQDIDDLKRQNQILESQIRSLEKAKTTGNFSSVNMMDNALITNARGDSISAFDGGSGSESSDSESSHHGRRKKMKTSSPATSSSGT